MVTHGWPGSIVEFLKVIGPLTESAAHGGEESDAFHVVCPSLPGYGFSEKPAAAGWGVERIASAWEQAATRFTDLRHWNEPDRGGHFAGFEQPELFVSEVRAFFSIVR